MRLDRGRAGAGEGRPDFEKGFVTRVSDVIGVELEDEKGNLNQMLKILADGQINVNYIYSFVIREGQGSCDDLPHG